MIFCQAAYFVQVIRSLYSEYSATDVLPLSLSIWMNEDDLRRGITDCTNSVKAHTIFPMWQAEKLQFPIVHFSGKTEFYRLL